MLPGGIDSHVYIARPSGPDIVRSKPGRDVCWAGIEQGIFDFYSSDHCPFRYNDEKDKLAPKDRTSFRRVPNEISGVRTRLPILFSEGVVKKRIDLSHFAPITATNHARAYGLYPRKGGIAIGADADIAIWDPSVKRTLRHADPHDGSDYTPHEGSR